MTEELKKLLQDNMLQIVVTYIIPWLFIVAGGVWALAKFLLERYDRKISKNVEYLKTCLRQVIIPLERNMPSFDKLKAEEIVSWFKIAKELYETYFLFVPHAHIRIVKDNFILS